MKKSASIALFLIEISVISLALPLCTVQTYQINRNYACGTTQRDIISGASLPSNWNGAKKAVFGLWFQNLIDMSCVNGWGLIFKATYDINENDARIPAIYQRINSLSGAQELYFGYVPQLTPTIDQNSTTLFPSIVNNNWYYIIAVADLTLNMFYMYLYDSTAVVNGVSSGVIVHLTLPYYGLVQRTYLATDSLVYGSDPPLANLASITVSYPSVIVGRTISTDYEITMMAYTLQADPVVTVDLFGIGAMRSIIDYDLLNNILDTTSSIPYSTDFGTTDGTATSTLYSLWTDYGIYQTIQLESASQTLLLSPSKDFSFIDSWGFLSFGMRIVFKMKSLSFSSGCSYHWLLRRARTTTGAVLFGVGVKQDGSMAVSFGGNIASGATAGFITTGQWITLKLGCFSRGFTNKFLCMFLKSDGLTQNREEIWVSYTGASLYTSDSTTDHLLIGGSACGKSSIFTLMIDKGFIPERLDDCRWGCSLQMPSSSSCYHVADFSNSCPAGKTKIASRTECIACPLGCATCSVIDFVTMKLSCVTCSAGLILSQVPSVTSTPSVLEKVCTCSTAGQYFDVVTKTCKPRTTITASFDLVSGTSYQFKLSFSSTPTDIGLLAKVLLPQITTGDYPGTSSPTLMLVNNQYFLINFYPNNAVPAGTTLSISGISTYNTLVYNPYMLSPQTLTYVFPESSSPSSPSSSTPQTSTSTQPEIYSPRNITTLMSVLMIIFGLLGSTSLPLLKILIDIMLFKFININYPSNFKDFIVPYIGHGFFMPNPFGEVEPNASLIPQSTNGQFQLWDISVVFLQNAGSLLTKEIICGGCILIFWFAHFLCYELSQLKQITEKVLYIFQWRITLCYLLADFAEIMLYSIIHIQEGSLRTAYDRMSVSAIAIMWAIYVAFGVYMFYLLNIRKPNKKTLVKKRLGNASQEMMDGVANESIGKDEFPQSMKIICQDIHQDTALSRNYFFVYEIQTLGVVVMLATTEVSGLAQAFFYILFTSFYIMYFMFVRPFKKKLLYVIVFVNEGCQLALGIIAAILGANDLYSGTMNEDTKSSWGTIMIWIISNLLIFSCVIAVVDVLVQLIQHFQRNKVTSNSVQKIKLEENDLLNKPPINEGQAKIEMDSQGTMGEGIKRRKIVIE